MSISANEKKTILKFVESNRMSLRNLKINGGSMISRPGDVSHSKTSSARKLSTPSYQIKTLNLQSQSRNASKDLREMRSEMIHRIADLITEISSTSTRLRSSSKILEAILVFLKRVFEPNEKVTTIVAFLESHLFASINVIPPHLLSDFQRLYCIQDEKLSFRDLWAFLAEKSVAEHSRESSPSSTLFQKQFQRLENQLQKSESENQEMAKKLREQSQSLGYWREIAKQKFEMTRDLLECRFKIIKMNGQNRKLTQHYDQLKSVEERLIIREIQLVKRVNDSYKLIDKQNVQITDLQSQVLQQKLIINQSLSDRKNSLDGLQAAKATLSRHLEQLEQQIEVLGFISKPDFDNKISSNLAHLERYSKTTEKPSRFSISQKKPLISPSSKKFLSKMTKVGNNSFASNEPNSPGNISTKSVDYFPNPSTIGFVSGRSVISQSKDKPLPLQQLLLSQVPIASSIAGFEAGDLKTGYIFFFKEILQSLKASLENAEQHLLQINLVMNETT